MYIQVDGFPLSLGLVVEGKPTQYSCIHLTRHSEFHDLSEGCSYILDGATLDGQVTLVDSLLLH